jgi:hypothetical protein
MERFAIATHQAVANYLATDKSNSAIRRPINEIPIEPKVLVVLGTGKFKRQWVPNSDRFPKQPTNLLLPPCDWGKLHRCHAAARILLLCSEEYSHNIVAAEEYQL